MKKLLTIAAAATLFGTPAIAQAASEPTPSGEGITERGMNPDGQPCTPLGYNRGLDVYADCIAMGGPAPGLEAYPSCSRFITDRCRQTYTRWTQ